jgi:hypothetical protein
MRVRTTHKHPLFLTCPEKLSLSVKQCISGIYPQLCLPRMVASCEGYVIKHFALITLVIIVGMQEASAQAEIQNRPLKLFTECINEAIQGGNLRKHEIAIVFECYGSNAQNFFQYLGNNKQTFDEQSSSGKYRVRYTHSIPGPHRDRCWQHVEKPDGSSTARYGCVLFFHAGTFLNE